MRKGNGSPAPALCFASLKSHSLVYPYNISSAFGEIVKFVNGRFFLSVIPNTVTLIIGCIVDNISKFFQADFFNFTAQKFKTILRFSFSQKHSYESSSLCFTSRISFGMSLRLDCSVPTPEILPLSSYSVKGMLVHNLSKKYSVPANPHASETC